MKAAAVERSLPWFCRPTLDEVDRDVGSRVAGVTIDFRLGQPGIRSWLVAAVLTLASCGGSGAPSPAATASVSPSSSLISTTALADVAHRIFPPATSQSHPPGPEGYVECEFSTGVDFDFSTCPVTARFLSRLHQNPSASGRSRPFCRCQNILPKRDITVSAIQAGGVAHVDLGNATIDLIIISDRGTLLVDDTQCPGKGSNTSYYIDPVPPCS